MSTKEDLKKKIETDPDFIYCPSSENSLEKLMKKHPNGISTEKMAQVLTMTPEEVESAYENAVEKIRTMLKVGEE